MPQDNNLIFPLATQLRIRKDHMHKLRTFIKDVTPEMLSIGGELNGYFHRLLDEVIADWNLYIQSEIEISS